MERKEFIKLLTTGTLLGCAGCLESQNSYPAPSEIDFTLDLTQGENAVLQSAGASLVKYGVIIARQLNNEFVVFSKACSHLGATLHFQPAQNNFVCPRHYSYFDITGYPINGPASLPIRKYKTKLDGNNLRVYSF